MHLNRKAIVSGILVLIAAVLLSACGTTSGPSAVKSEAKGSAVLVDKAVWQSQSPEDGTHIDAGAEFDITWFMTNTGTTTWTTDYSLRYFAGTNLMKPGKPPRYNLTKAVEPGATGEFSADAVAPWEPGTYQMFVVLSNGNDENFSKVDITIVVGETEE